MTDEFKSLGAYLKDQRIAKNLTLKEVENATSIRSTYIELIEEGKTKELISPIYAMGFMKQYANFLGIDMDLIVKDNPGAFKLPNEKHEFAYGIGTMEMRGMANKGSRSVPVGLIIGALPILGALFYGIAKLVGII